MSEELPIAVLRAELVREDGPVVVSAPTGSGKSTEVPRWCAGRVVVVEPRRVACRSLAQRVAEREGVALGGAVGYQVRDDARLGADTRIRFVTPGIALQQLPELLEADTFILDELHERRLDVDLLLAVLARRYRGRLIAMSATLDGERVARHLGGRHLSASGRLYDVDVRYRDGTLLPDRRGLEERVVDAVRAASADPGDILVFLPGKAEIASCGAALDGSVDTAVLPLHGGLTLEEQSRVFAPDRRRKIILATNVAETSLTIPGIGVVIDSGLVRQNRYHAGRGFLSLVPIATDSAEQRAGRAGRTGPGICYRLWDRAAVLEARTRPEVERESLVPLVLGAAALGEAMDELPFLDRPRPHAVESARRDLEALGAIDSDARITERGRALFGLPLDPALGRLVVEAEETGPLDDVIDLVAALATSQPLFASTRPDEEDDLRAQGCDAVACIRALREGEPRRHGLRRQVLAEAREMAARLRRAFGIHGRPPDGPIDRRRLAMTAIAADPRSVYVARRRGRRVAWSNGGTEVDLGRESAGAARPGCDALVALETRALGAGRRDKKVIITCAMPIEEGWLAEAEIGHERLGEVRIEEGRVVADVERVHAKRVISVRSEVPHGARARRAIARLFATGALWPEMRERVDEGLEAASLATRLAQQGVEPFRQVELPLDEAIGVEVWVATRLEELGLESGEDLALVSPEDLAPPGLSEEVRGVLDRHYPRRVHVGDAAYRAVYDLERRQVTLRKTAGQRKEPPAFWQLPPFPGLRVRVEDRGRVRTIR